MTSRVSLRSHTETDLLAPLVDWLQARRQVRPGAIVVEEFPWQGRRVDLAVLSASGISSSFELKLAHTRKVLEQSSLNAIAFDRSYLVTATRPSTSNMENAHALGVGVVYVSLPVGIVRLLMAPRAPTIHPVVRRRLRAALIARSG